jgi:hypothetical protein
VSGLLDLESYRILRRSGFDALIKIKLRRHESNALSKIGMDDMESQRAKANSALWQFGRIWTLHIVDQSDAQHQPL